MTYACFDSMTGTLCVITSKAYTSYTGLLNAAREGLLGPPQQFQAAVVASQQGGKVLNIQLPAMSPRRPTRACLASNDGMMV